MQSNKLSMTPLCFKPARGLRALRHATGNPAGGKLPTLRSAIKRLAACVLLALPCVQAMADVAPVSVSGNKVVFGGQIGSASGMSFYWSNNGWPGARFYNAGAVGYLKDDFKATLVRAAMGVEDNGGYLQYPADNKARVKAVVDAAIAKDMYVSSIGIPTTRTGTRAKRSPFSRKWRALTATRTM